MGEGYAYGEGGLPTGVSASEVCLQESEVGSASGRSVSRDGGVGSAYSGVCLQGWVGRTPPLGYYRIWSKSRQYASYWNAFLFIQDGCRMLTKLWEYNVFSCVCVSTRGGGFCTGPSPRPPHPSPTQGPSPTQVPIPPCARPQPSVTCSNLFNFNFTVHWVPLTTSTLMHKKCS